MTAAVATAGRSHNPGRLQSPGTLMGVPAALWVSLFVLMPLGLVAVYSFFGVDRNFLGAFTLDNYEAVLGSAALRGLLLRTVLVATTVTVLALLIAVPIAYYLSRFSRHTQLILGILLLPYLVGYVPRILSLRLTLGSSGLAGSLVDLVGLPRELVSPLLFGHAGTIIGLLHAQLPVMVILVYLAMERIDRRLFEAAEDLGAGSYRVFFTIAVPNSVLGIAAGSTLVFAAALGAYVEPALMGGATGRLTANIVAQRFIQFYDWGRGSALAMSAIMVIVAISIAIYFIARLFRISRHVR